MKSKLRIIIERRLPSFLSKRVIVAGQQYKKAKRHEERVKKYGSDKPFTFHVNIENIIFDIILDPVHNCVVDAEIAERGYWEKDIAIALKKYLKKGDVFLDIGANIGIHSLFAASLLEETGKVYSFEPIPRLAHQLQKSIELNSFSNIKVCNFALGEHDEEEKTIYIRDENIGGSSLFRFENIELVKVIGTEKVALKQLDSFLADATINIIKIDVEGFEYEVLKGATKILQQNHPIIFMEYSPIFYSQESEKKSYDIIIFLESLGYSFYLLNEDVIDLRSWLQRKENRNSQIDIICRVM